MAAFWLATTLSAATIAYNPAPTTDTGWNTCGTTFYASLAGDVCRTVAFFQPDSLDQEFRNNPGGISVIFGAGFNAWNKNNNNSNNPPGVNQGWTLTFGGDLGGAFNVSIAMAEQFNAANNVVNNNVVRGGAEIQITPDATLRTTLTNEVNALNSGGGDYKITWVQGLYDNYALSGNTVPAFYEMDTTSATNPSYTDSYPPQPGSNGFYDQPKFRYQPLDQPQGFFYANAYLAIESQNNKILTVFDGVDYGWNNFVATPEPGTWLLLGGGLLVTWLARKRNWSRA
jgi:hypothetical protein